jgi:hypothetical protein
MTKQSTLTRANLKTPRAAAIAGILFSILLFLVLWLLRISVPDNPQEPGSWLKSESSTVALAVNLVPFAGIAFLWFIGVLRDRLGENEDRFFATVFFGSGLLFLAMLFAAAAVADALIISFKTAPAQLKFPRSGCISPTKRTWACFPVMPASTIDFSAQILSLPPDDE